MEFGYQVSEIWLGQKLPDHDIRQKGLVKRDSWWVCLRHISPARKFSAVYFFQVVLVLSTATWHGFIGIPFLYTEICLCRNHQNHLSADSEYFGIWASCSQSYISGCRKDTRVQFVQVRVLNSAATWLSFIQSTRLGVDIAVCEN